MAAARCPWRPRRSLVPTSHAPICTPPHGAWREHARVRGRCGHGTRRFRHGQFERQPRVCTRTPAHTPSTTRTQSLEPSLWAEGYETERLESFGSETEITA